MPNLTPLDRARIAQEQVGMVLYAMIERDDTCPAERFALAEALDEIEELARLLESGARIVPASAPAVLPAEPARTTH